MKDSGRPSVSGVNYLNVVIGDKNDNLHYGATKKIKVFDYRKSVSGRGGGVAARENNGVMIGTVYAEDKDDWDMQDKEFKFSIGTSDEIKKNFDVVESVNDQRFAGNGYLPG